MQTVHPIMSPFLFLSSCDSRFLLNRMMPNLFLVSFKNIRTSFCCCCSCCCWHCCHHCHCGIQCSVNDSNSSHCDVHSDSIVRVKQLKKNKHIKTPQYGGNYSPSNRMSQHCENHTSHIIIIVVIMGLYLDFAYCLV